MSVVHDQGFGAKMPTYATVLQLSNKISKFPVPPILRLPGFGSESRSEEYVETVELILQQHIVAAIKEISKSI